MKLLETVHRCLGLYETLLNHYGILWHFSIDSNVTWPKIIIYIY